MTWAWIGLAACVAGAVAVAVEAALRRRALEGAGHAPTLRRMVIGRSPRRRVVRGALWVMAFALAAAAAADPRREGETVTRWRGLDVVVAVDFSKSMLASDVYPSRLERARREADDLLDALAGDRVAVVAFAGAATYFPLTRDHAAARQLYRGLAPHELPPGSDLGEAVRVARCVARPGLLDDPGCRGAGGRGRGGEPLSARSGGRDERGDGDEHEPDDASGRSTSGTRAPAVRDDRARVVLLFTDGGDTTGGARAEVARAAALGVVVIPVGVGTTRGELVPEIDADGRRIGWKKAAGGDGFVTTRLDRAALDALAALGGARTPVVIDAPGSATDALVRRLADRQRGDLAERRARGVIAVYPWFLAPALLLLVIEACLVYRRRRALYLEET